MRLAAVVLAAGKGTRMKSNLPKVLHKVCGQPMIVQVLDALNQIGVEKIVTVVGFSGDQVERAISGQTEIVYQQQQLGTAHALLQAQNKLSDFPGHILVVCGDTPLIKPETLASLAQFHVARGAVATVLTARLNDPTGYGRVIRDETGRIARIVEQKDASPDDLAVDEINSGIYCLAVPGLFKNLAGLTPENAQGEYYLTDIIETYVGRGLPVEARLVEDPAEIQGINDRKQLAGAEAVLRQRVLEELMLSGVTVMDPHSTFIDRSVEVGKDTIIYPFTIIEGKTVIGEECIIGPGSHLTDVKIGDKVSIQNSVLQESDIGDGSLIGPFAYIRPGCQLGRGVKVGDFVELKKTVIGDGSKVPHLSYVGDAQVGEKVNIGAGTITCNYDGKNKWQTRIGNNAFIGSNTNLVAPVEVGEGAVTGAGSTITKDVPAGALGVARGLQKVIPNWSERKK